MFPVEVCFQVIQPGTPEGAEFFRPGVNFLERFGPELIKPVAAFAAFGDEASVLEDLQVLGYRGERNPKGSGEIGGGALAGLECL